MKLGIIGIVGEEAKKDFWGTMTRLVEMGYQGIEAIEPTLLEGDAAAKPSPPQRTWPGAPHRLRQPRRSQT